MLSRLCPLFVRFALHRVLEGRHRSSQQKQPLAPQVRFRWRYRGAVPWLLRTAPPEPAGTVLDGGPQAVALRPRPRRPLFRNLARGEAWGRAPECIVRIPDAAIAFCCPDTIGSASSGGTGYMYPVKSHSAVVDPQQAQHGSQGDLRSPERFCGNRSGRGAEHNLPGREKRQEDIRPGLFNSASQRATGCLIPTPPFGTVLACTFGQAAAAGIKPNRLCDVMASTSLLLGNQVASRGILSKQTAGNPQKLAGSSLLSRTKVLRRSSSGLGAPPPKWLLKVPQPEPKHPLCPAQTGGMGGW